MNVSNAASAANVIGLENYRDKRSAAARASLPAPPYLLWYPGFGYVVQVSARKTRGSRIGALLKSLWTEAKLSLHLFASGHLLSSANDVDLNPAAMC